MKTNSYLTKVASLLMLTLLGSLTSCEDILEQYFPKNPGKPAFPSLGVDIPFYALSGGTKLDAYSTKDPTSRTASVAITGLQSGERILAVDFRPATGQLYGVSSGSRLYVINQNTGAARAVGAGAFTPALGGNLVGFDFNPTVDRIRLVTSTGQNLRLNPETGTVAATDGAINGAAGATLTGVAYTNNTTQASSTALYAINTQNQQLYLVNPPNEGTVVAVGSLNLPVAGDGGFDIDAKTGTALGLYTIQGKPTLFSVNLATGAARSLAQYDANLGYSGIAIPTRPVAYASGFITIPLRGTVNYLYTFDPTDTSSPTAAITQRLELAPNQSIVGLDFRPATGQLYALVTGEGRTYRDGITYMASTRLYTINLVTAEATPVADLSVPLQFGNSYAFDFNPVADRIRIVSLRGGQNLRVNPTDGTVTVDGNLNPAVPFVSAVAYDNSFAGATSTNLYVLGSNKLYLQNPPNAGTLTEIGTIGLSGFSASTTSVDVFDIGGTSNTAYGISIGSNNQNEVSTLNLAAPTATYLRKLNLSGGPFIYSLAVAPGF
ncbi:conserved hypothetical protein [Hymenobacter roseosalivarius DSM 11622]|uniref:DUF4394 domain-containing protein n=1 Tax=Hymenobacter roseosalivarius DSM 11622 TaxID=645990 RepID=A0A1W1UVD7_9BACT|nr:DUF4394 domain-containing protein [Hymenobacter roseosalivarius]SMB84674.1 conserved hypothetical protein [Hymenobacter roseosalivarius DSM 11622]